MRVLSACTAAITEQPSQLDRHAVPACRPHTLSATRSWLHAASRGARTRRHRHADVAALASSQHCTHAVASTLSACAAVSSTSTMQCTASRHPLLAYSSACCPYMGCMAACCATARVGPLSVLATLLWHYDSGTALPCCHHMLRVAVSRRRRTVRACCVTQLWPACWCQHASVQCSAQHHSAAVVLAPATKCTAVQCCCVGCVSCQLGGTQCAVQCMPLCRVECVASTSVRAHQCAVHTSQHAALHALVAGARMQYSTA